MHATVVSGRRVAFAPLSPADREALAPFLAPPALARMGADIEVVYVNLRAAIVGKSLNTSRFNAMRRSALRVRTALASSLDAISRNHEQNEQTRAQALSVADRLVGNLESVLALLGAAAQ